MALEHNHRPAATMRLPSAFDYSLTGENADRAVELGLSEADWYQCAVPRATMRRLLVRSNGPAIRDTIIWLGLIVCCGGATITLWGSWWALLPYLGYAMLYASTSDSRWHESSHGTAFKTDWMNNALYELASFMVMRESVVWRWSHTRHHSDTIIVGRDPEIVVPRPPNIKALVWGFFAFPVIPKYFTRIVMHSFGQMAEEEKTFIPESEFSKVYHRAGIYLAIYFMIVALAIATWIATGSLLWGSLPLLLALPHLFGSWLMPIYGLTQHAGLAENVLDHRLNCRTVNMNRINRFLYWNMNFHVEHHMFPLVPYHRLPELHELVKDDCPASYRGLLVAWREIVPALRRQVKDPTYHVKRILPDPKTQSNECLHRSDAPPDAEGWLDVMAADNLDREDVVRFDHGRKSFAIYRGDLGQLYATDGICTHGNTHLANGLVKGKVIECSKHNGRFDLEDGSPARAPICRALATYPVEERAGRLRINVMKAGGKGARKKEAFTLRVINCRSVSTFIRELVFEPVDQQESVKFEPGDHLQFDIPAYERIEYRDFDIPEPYASVWRNQHVFDLGVTNSDTSRCNNYSIANHKEPDRKLMFNVRIATPPAGQLCPPGVGSSYMFNLKAGDTVTATGPFGNFHIKPTYKEMVYIGGGAGMAPLRAHLSHLLNNENTARKLSYWYGARSQQEIYYAEYFEKLAATHDNFDFHLALSEPLKKDNWMGHVGYIHEVVREHYLNNHSSLKAVEFYLCGPPMMIKACTKMLGSLGVEPCQIAYDEF
ncbi:Na(+)-translocating NADH-quinone reductase subunit F [Planctomycetes bacterium CA13]|uniref:Na(+)-translocating NADH-quinone reductase subunit F n=1 Tax=Novipirellula herctigrandis TaxID=2527986 RepID=A0A5C5Z5J4_9BACT|nr:Na(+)-translocating NADH-quinone reductase subunit F [Planctomycetes bacterium CA13]